MKEGGSEGGREWKRGGREGGKEEGRTCTNVCLRAAPVEQFGMMRPVAKTFLYTDLDQLDSSSDSSCKISLCTV